MVTGFTVSFCGLPVFFLIGSSEMCVARLRGHEVGV